MILKNLTLPENVTCLMTSPTLHSQTVPVYIPPSNITLPLPRDSPINEFIKEQAYTSSFPPLTPKSQAPHGIIPKILKSCADALATLLACLLLFLSLLLPFLLNGNPIFTVPVHESRDRS